MDFECATLENVSTLTASQLLEQETIYALYDISDNAERERVKALLLVHAKALGCEKELKSTLRAYDKEEAELNRPVKILPEYFYQDERTKRWRINCPLLAKHVREHEHYAFVRNNGHRIANRYWYRDGCYRRISDDEIKGIIKPYITKHLITALKMQDVQEVFQDIVTDATFYEADSLDADENIINFQNGLLNLETMELMPHTPFNLSTVQLPCNWNPTAADAPVFDGFMKDLTGGNEETRELLLEFMGACLSNIKGSRFKKALFMVGSGDTGKSQLIGLMSRLLGTDNFCSVELQDLENNRFASAQLLGKRLAGSCDTGFLPVEQMRIFKQATGGDPIRMEFKGVDGFQAPYNGFFWFAMNDLPRFGGDRGAWVYNRIMIVRCDNVIPADKQDKHLCDKMFGEREAIVRMAVDALQRTIKRQYIFAETEDVKGERVMYSIENSAVLTFFSECCQFRNSTIIRDEQTTANVRRAFRNWCEENGHKAVPSVQRFNREIADFVGCSVDALQTRTASNRFYTFKLTEEAQKEYLPWCG